MDKKYGVVFFLLFFILLLFSFVLAEDIPCCIPERQSDGVSFFYLIEDEQDGSYRYVEESDCGSFYYSNVCLNERGNTLPDLDVGCCCTGSYSHFDNYAPTVYRGYCGSIDYTEFKLSDGSSCDVVCSGGAPASSLITIRGQVKIDSVVVESASVSITSSYSTETNSAGSFTLNVPSTTYLELSISKQNYNINGVSHICSAIETYDVSSVDEQNVLDVGVISLHCVEDDGSENTGDVCVSWIPKAVSSCRLVEGQYVKILEYEQPIGSSIDEMCGPKPQNGLTSEGCQDEIDLDLPQGSCGNRVLNQGEQCDGSNFLIGTQIVDSVSCTQFNERYTDGIVGCTADCRFDLRECSSICDDSHSCTSESCHCPHCSNSPVCGLDCSDKKPIFYESLSQDQRLSERDIVNLFTQSSNTPYRVDFKTGTSDLKFSWNYDSSCSLSVSRFKVSVCLELRNGICAVGTERNFFTSGRELTLELENIMQYEQTNYCVNICAIEGNSERCVYGAGEPWLCFKSGDGYCMNEHPEGYNCESNPAGDVRPSGCLYDSGLATLRQDFVDCEHPEAVCVESEYRVSNPTEFPGAVCKLPVACASCNGVFGLYGDYNLRAEFETNFFTCESLLEQTSPYANLCYKDTTVLPHQEYRTCGGIKTCYDYMGESACKADTCNRFTEQGGCEWAVLNSELGVGVCRPTNETHQDCSQCSQTSPIGFCSSSTCSLYGDCHFIGESSDYFTSSDIGATGFPACVAANNIGCFHYTSKDDCIGEGTAAQNSSFAITYENGVRTGRDHKQLTSSNDKFGFGTCKWDDEKNICFKDANNYYDPTKNQYDDCYEQGAIPSPDCFSDNEPPVTTIILPREKGDNVFVTLGKNELNNLLIDVSDNVYGVSDIKTFISVSNNNLGCFTNDYPTKQYISDSGFFSDADLNNLVSKSYVLCYYSEDKAKNLEVVDYVPFYLDADDPEISNFKVDKNTEEIALYVYRTDVDITFVLSKPAHCIGTLHVGNEEGDRYGQELNHQDSSFAIEYTYLHDGEYVFVLRCDDEFGNYVTRKETIQVEGDTRISQVEPRGDVFSTSDASSVPVSLATIYNAECAIYQNGISVLPLSSEEQEDGGYIHTGTLSNKNQHGLHYFETRCEFLEGDQEGELFEGNPSDHVYYFVDGQSPMMDLFSEENLLQPYTEYSATAPWQESRSFRLDVSDKLDEVDFGFSGVDTIRYCFSQTYEEDFDSLAEVCAEDNINVKDCDGASSCTVSFSVDQNFVFVYYVVSDVFGNSNSNMVSAKIAKPFGEVQIWLVHQISCDMSKNEGTDFTNDDCPENLPSCVANVCVNPYG